MIVVDKKDEEHKIVIDEKTKIKKKKEIINLSDIVVGDRVTVYYKKTKSGNDMVSTIRVLRKKTSKTANK